MKFLFSIFITLIPICLFSQVKYVAQDSIPICTRVGGECIASRYAYYGDTVEILKRTKEPVILTDDSNTKREDRFSTWTQIRTKDERVGWVVDNQLKQYLVPPPAKIIGLNQGDVHQDEIYPIGWSKNAFAYIIEGYIDGAVDGLTVRYYIKNFNGNYLDSVEDYTSYEEPIEAMWKQQAFNIQNSLLRNKIVPLTNAVKPDSTPILVNKNDTLHLYWDMKNFPIIIKGNINGVEKDLLTIESGIYRIMILGTLKNPFDKNKLAVIVAFIMDATAHYVDVIMVDLKKFKR